MSRRNSHQSKQERNMSFRQIARDHAVTRGYVNGLLQLVNRGFFGRLRWLLFGK